MTDYYTEEKKFTVLLVEDDLNDIFLVKRAFKKAQIQNPLQVVTGGLSRSRKAFRIYYPLLGPRMRQAGVGTGLECQPSCIKRSSRLGHYRASALLRFTFHVSRFTFSNRHPMRDHPVLWDDHNSIPDVIIGMVHLLRLARRRDYHAVADAGVFVHDRVFNPAVGADANARLARLFVLHNGLVRFIIIAAQNNRAIQ